MIAVAAITCKSFGHSCYPQTWPEAVVFCAILVVVFVHTSRAPSPKVLAPSDCTPRACSAQLSALSLRVPPWLHCSSRLAANSPVEHRPSGRSTRSLTSGVQPPGGFLVGTMGSRSVQTGDHVETGDVDEDMPALRLL